jgi:hypothetical protein
MFFFPNLNYLVLFRDKGGNEMKVIVYIGIAFLIVVYSMNNYLNAKNNFYTVKVIDKKTEKVLSNPTIMALPFQTLKYDERLAGKGSRIYEMDAFEIAFIYASAKDHKMKIKAEFITPGETIVMALKGKKETEKTKETKKETKTTTKKEKEKVNVDLIQTEK